MQPLRKTLKGTMLKETQWTPNTTSCEGVSRLGKLKLRLSYTREQILSSHLSYTLLVSTLHSRLFRLLKIFRS
jgi:hypothetical protein